MNLHSTNSLSAQYMDSKHYSRLVMNFLYRGTTFSFKLLNQFGMKNAQSGERFEYDRQFINGTSLQFLQNVSQCAYPVPYIFTVRCNTWSK